MTIEGTIADAVADRIEARLAELERRIAMATVERPSALLTASELARELRVSRSTIQRIVSDGCPRVMVCDSPRYALVDVLAWLADRPKREASGR